MENKTHIQSKEGKHDLIVVRDFDLPVELLFKAFIDPELFAEWMGTKVIKHDMYRHGSYEFETSDPKGNVVFKANGCIHECTLNTRIIRTFEMEGTPFPVQIEFLDFEKSTDDSSRLTMHIVYKTGEDRDQMLQLPFAYGLNMAHNRLQEILGKLN